MVRSGSEALAEVLQREFAVILLDVNMPDIDGLETAEYLRRYKKSAHTPIIFITAYADEMQTAKGYSLGAVDYILSPIQPDILRSKVKVFVELFNLQQQTRVIAEERVALERAETGRKAAEDANRLKDEFIAMLSHELRNPLAPIRTAMEIIRRVAPRDPTLTLAGDMIERQVVHLVRLVDDLLDMARMSRGRILLKKEHLELEKVIAHGLEPVRPLIESRRSSRPKAGAYRLTRQRTGGKPLSSFATPASASNRSFCREYSSCSSRGNVRLTAARVGWESA
jgi:CheY-like chemotaxis protein